MKVKDIVNVKSGDFDVKIFRLGASSFLFDGKISEVGSSVLDRMIMTLDIQKESGTLFIGV